MTILSGETLPKPAAQVPGAPHRAGSVGSVGVSDGEPARG